MILVGRTRRYEWTYCKLFNVRLRGASQGAMGKGTRDIFGINFREKGMDISTNKGKFEEHFWRPVEFIIRYM